MGIPEKTDVPRGYRMGLAVHGDTRGSWLSWESWLALLQPVALTPGEYKALCSEGGAEGGVTPMDETLEDTLIGRRVEVQGGGKAGAGPPPSTSKL